MIQLLIEQGRIDRAVTNHTSNRPALKKVLDGHTLEDLSERCGVSTEEIDEISRLYSPPGPTATLIGWGLQRHVFGGENVRFINALALLSGNGGRRGGGSTFNISSMRNFNRSWAAPHPTLPRRSFLLPANRPGDNPGKRSAG